MKTPLFLILLLLSFYACNQSSGSPSGSNSGQPMPGGGTNTGAGSYTAQSAPGAGTNTSAGSGQVFKPAEIVDQQYKIVAIKLLIPDKWNIRSQVLWTEGVCGWNDDVAATAPTIITDPSGEMQAQFFSDKFYLYYTAPTYGIPCKGKMGHYFTNELPGASKAMRNYLIPRERANVQGLRLIKETVVKPLHDIGGGMEQDMLEQVEYTLNGKLYEENIYGSYVYFGSAGAVFWDLKACYGFRAPKGQLESNLPLFKTITGSLALTKNFADLYAKVLDWRTKDIDQRLAVEQQEMYIRQQAAAHVRADIQGSYDNTVKTHEAIQAEWGDVNNGVKDYQNPSGETVKLPIGYDKWYIDKYGNYISGNDGYNPNKDPTKDHDWTPYTPTE